jgi:four helix bundle protein
MKSNHLIPMQRLDCYVVAKEIARRVHVAKIRDTELRDQATRASKSCFLTLCEGLPNDGVAMRRKYFTESHNSLHEVVGAIDLAEAIGAIDADVAGEVQALAFRLKPMLRALLR